MNRRVLAWLVPLALIGGGVSAAPASAGALPASLLGESLNGDGASGTGTATCTSSDTSAQGGTFRGSGSETFSASGAATGPYPGTFTAQGTITLSTDATTFDVSETFTITSAAGTVNGTKRGTAIPTEAYTTPQGGEAICLIHTNGLGAVVNSLAFYSPNNPSNIPYSATIQTSIGTYVDSGRSYLLVYTGPGFGASNGAPAFSEYFDHSDGVAPNQASPSLATQASPAVVVGGSISDSATLAGGVSPTGTVTFKLYGPNDATCAGAVLATSTASVTGNGTYASAAFVTQAPGSYRWVAAYGGDSNNAAATGACNDANESVTVTAPPPTPGAVCRQAQRFIEGSAKYKALSAPVRASIDQQIGALCQRLASSPLTPTQKALTTTLVNGLAKSGWLTQAQATVLDGLIAQL